jgi:hypothetical protein
VFLKILEKFQAREGEYYGKFRAGNRNMNNLLKILEESELGKRNILETSGLKDMYTSRFTKVLGECRAEVR